jgi:hypothetical protein
MELLPLLDIQRKQISALQDLLFKEVKSRDEFESKFNQRH